ARKSDRKTHQQAVSVSRARSAGKTADLQVIHRRLFSTGLTTRDDHGRAARLKNNEAHSVPASRLDIDRYWDCRVSCPADSNAAPRSDFGNRGSGDLFPRRRNHSEISGPILQRSRWPSSTDISTPRPAS